MDGPPLAGTGGLWDSNTSTDPGGSDRRHRYVTCPSRDVRIRRVTSNRRQGERIKYCQGVPEDLTASAIEPVWQHSDVILRHITI